MGNIYRNCDEISRLKNASSIDDDYLEAATGGVCNIYRNTPVLESLFDKVAGLQVYWKETPTLVFSFGC